MVPGLEHRRLTSFDGTEIAYQVRGDGPAVVFANGLGGTCEAYRHIYAALGQRYRIICWDYRGLYGSSAPKDPNRLEVADQCRDLELILAHEGVERALHFGWSMGVQVNFEYFRRHGDRIVGFVAINGTYGRPFRTALSSRVVERVIPVALKAVRAQAGIVGRATRSVVGWDGLVGLLRRVGVVSPTIDRQAFEELALGFADIDWKIYTTLLEKLGEHDAEDVLPHIQVPTLIITGDRDILTPPMIAEKMHRKIIGSRLLIIEDGTHYTPVEYPTIIGDEVIDFLARVPGYGEQLANTEPTLDAAQG